MFNIYFAGALVGALIGDCLGCYWEMMSWKGTHPLEKVCNCRHMSTGMKDIPFVIFKLTSQLPEFLDSS